MSKNYHYFLFFVLFFTQNIIAQNSPTANNDFDTTDINTTLTVNAPGVLNNDTDLDGDTLTVTQFIVNGVILTAGQTANTFQGDITVNADGSYTFIPAAGYTGSVPSIRYFISDGLNTTSSNLFITVEPTTNLLEVQQFTSCNQGYTADGNYKIRYSFMLRNISNARDYHASSLITNIDLVEDFENIFGLGCATAIDGISISTNNPTDYINNPYPQDWNLASLNPNFEDFTETSFFSPSAITNNTLYPRQSIMISFCVYINPFCGGRPNPTPSGSGIDFDNTLNITSSTDAVTDNLTIADFHTTQTSVAAGIFIPSVNPTANFDGTYDYTNTIVITNEGSTTATNVNYNMGLGNFINNGVVFTNISITQTSGNSKNIDTSYDGDTNTKLLLPNQSLGAGETIIFEVSHTIEPFSSTSGNLFSPLNPSMTQGPLDGLDEEIPSTRRLASFVTWSDTLGNHLDNYYPLASSSSLPSSDNQCECTAAAMRFLFSASLSTVKTMTVNDVEPNGILEHEQVTFQLTTTNTSTIVQAENLQIQDNLNTICSGNIIAISTPTIVTSTALNSPILNPNYNGTTDINLLNGTSGILEPNQSIVIEFTVIFSEDCIGTNTANFSGNDPINNTISSSGSVAVSIFTDTDNDGISNFNDIDDDNDTIPDILESGGLNPLDDHDNDLIPNYRDLDFGIDLNNDGIIDIFDFDNDGVPNHFDLDSDNDGIFDISEVGNSLLDTDSNGITDGTVGANGLDNSVENDDTITTTIDYVIPNTDATGNGNYLDIDADGDGIVDNIESQSTDNYITPNGAVNVNGIDTAYPNGITPVDTEGDTIPDYLDINSDNDIRDDFIEGWDTNNDGTPEVTATNNDQDNDGLDDAFDNNDNQVNPTNSQIPTSFPNVDITDTPERDWRELIAIVLIINNVSTTEGGDLIFTISLTTLNDNSILLASLTPITIDLSTSDGTPTTTTYDVATAPFDYNQVITNEITIPPFQTTSTFTVSSLDDNIHELDELFTLNGTITSNNTINNSIQGIGTIRDNEVPPTITMNDTIEEEGVDLVHTIVLSHPSSRPTNINIETSNLTATSIDDYTSFINTLIIDGTIDPANANTQITFNITTIIDDLNEPVQETLAVIGQVTSNNVGLQDLDKIGTILDIDPDPTIIISNPTVVEGNTLVFTLSMINPNTSLPTQNYQAIDFEIETNNLSAITPTDYTSLTTTISIPPNTESISINILTIDDNLNEDTEIMSLIATITSANVSNTFTIIEGLGTIRDNDIPNLFSPNNDGFSDTFTIAGIQDFPEFILRIYDRWGSEVYNYQNQGNLVPDWWDGTYKSEPVPEGVYFYTIDFNDGVTKPQTNFIQLIR